MNIDVFVNIWAIVLFCDESLLAVDIGHGYHFRKTYLEDLPYKDKVTFSCGELDVAYRFSELKDEGGTYFICLEKNDTFTLSLEQLKGTALQQDEQLELYKDRESEYLGRAFALLRIYQEGNIGCYDTFFRFDRKIGCVKDSHHTRSRYQSQNILDDRRYILNGSSAGAATDFVAAYNGYSYDLLKPVIIEFVLGTEPVDPSGFIQYTIALEMLLLRNDGNKSKGSMLSNRVAALIGESDDEIRTIQSEMRRLYGLRSKYVHEGMWLAISEKDLYLLESYVRRVLQKGLAYCNNKLTLSDIQLTWTQIKNDLIDELVQRVIALRNRAILT